MPFLRSAFINIHGLRLGPSASATPSEDDPRVKELMSAVSAFQQVISQPWVQELLGKLPGGQVSQAVSTPALEDPAGPLDIVNSRTHPAAYAKLGRRMASMSPSEFPQMQKLWSGNRADRVAKKKHVFLNFVKHYDYMFCAERNFKSNGQGC